MDMVDSYQDELEHRESSGHIITNFFPKLAVDAIRSNSTVIVGWLTMTTPMCTLSELSDFGPVP